MAGDRADGASDHEAPDAASDGGTDAIASRVLAAIGSDPTQAFVLLDDAGRPRWASPMLFSLFDVDLSAADPLANAMHPDDVGLVGEIFRTEQEGRADETFSLERRFELLVRLRAPAGGWRWVALRLHNRVDDPAVRGMVLQLTMANQEHSTVEAFDAAASGEPSEQVLAHVLESLHSGGTGDAQAVVFGPDGRALAATAGAGIRRGEPRQGAAWRRLSEGRVGVVVPVTGPGGTVFGTLVTVSNFPDVRPFTRSLAVAVARRVGLVLEAERARDELHVRAVSDALTGLRNRRFLYDHLERTDLGTHLSVAFVDLDGFKTINDRFGHHVGDAVLVEVAGRLRSLERPGDVVARLGGDEFVIVRHGHSLDDCALDRDRIVAAVEGDLAVAGRHIAVAASVGVASGVASRRLDLVAAADAAMYAGKPHRHRHDDEPGSGAFLHRWPQE